MLEITNNGAILLEISKYGAILLKKTNNGAILLELSKNGAILLEIPNNGGDLVRNIPFWGINVTNFWIFLFYLKKNASGAIWWILRQFREFGAILWVRGNLVKWGYYVNLGLFRDRNRPHINSRWGYSVSFSRKTFQFLIWLIFFKVLKIFR